MNLVLMQSWFLERVNPYSLNGVSWSPSCEVAFYALLPLLLPLARRLQPWVAWSMALTYWTGASAVTLWAVHRNYLLDGIYVFPPVRLGEFLLGVIAAVQVQRGWRLTSGRAAVLAVAGLGLMAVSWNRFPAADVGGAAVFFAVVVAPPSGICTIPTGG